MASRSMVPTVVRVLDDGNADEVDEACNGTWVGDEAKELAKEGLGEMGWAEDRQVFVVEV